jgi:hypothetical protein
MAKFYGPIGFSEIGSTVKGVWKPGEITEKCYYGDTISDTRKLQSGDNVNDDINIIDNISIIADQYARDNIHNMKYVVLNGSKWKIKSVGNGSPRLLLITGGIYNA